MPCAAPDAPARAGGPRPHRAALLAAAPQLPAARAVLQRREAEVSRLQAQQKQLQTRIATVGSGDALVREARRLGLVKPGERLFIVRGIAAWRTSTHRRRRASLPRPVDDRAVVERQLGRAPRAFRRVAVRCPFGRPAVAEQAPFDATAAVPDDQFWLTCPHLVAAIARLEAAGGVARWSRAAADDPALRASLERGAGGAARGCGRSCRSGSAAPAERQPEVPARPRRVRARPSRLRARRTDPRRGRAALAGGRVLLGSMIRASMEIELARQEWTTACAASNTPRPIAPRTTAAARDRDRDRRPATPDRAHVHAAGARRRLRRGRPLGARRAGRRAPRRRAGRETATVAGAAFALYARRASDYVP